MQFNSLQYAVFLIIVFFVFWFLLRKNLRLQNIFLLAASYIFYSWWDWRFLVLIIFLSSVNYISGILLGNYDLNTEERKRKFILLLVTFINLGLLGLFKYFNFFAESAVELFNAVGFKADRVTLSVILPLGISFYTFQTLGYTIDIYRTKYKPTKDVIAFFSFVSFFPLLLAGPIERGDTLLPQFFKKKEFEYEQAVNGMRQILWGVFKKVVIADNCAVFANQIFKNYETQPVTVLIMGILYFAFQIYGDFSGYSDIAIGSAKLLGFNLTTNFKTPYFSRDIAEFWRRWHISLSNWLRDYLFIPLNVQFRNLKIWGGIIAVLITFLLCGLWHGANLTFIVWGGLNGIYFIPLIISHGSGKNVNIVAEGKLFPSVKEIIQIVTTFSITSFAWVFFKASNIREGIKYINGIFSHEFFPVNNNLFPGYMIFLLIIFFSSEWYLFRYDDFEERFSNFKSVLRHSIYALTLILIFLYMQNEASAFIYFQF